MPRERPVSSSEVRTMAIEKAQLGNIGTTAQSAIALAIVYLADVLKSKR